MPVDEDLSARYGAKEHDLDQVDLVDFTLDGIFKKSNKKIPK